MVFNVSLPCSSATATGGNEDTTKESNVGNPIPTVVSGGRGNAESTDTSKIYGTVPPPVAPTNVPAPVTQAVPLLGKFLLCKFCTSLFPTFKVPFSLGY